MLTPTSTGESSVDPPPPPINSPLLSPCEHPTTRTTAAAPSLPKTTSSLRLTASQGIQKPIFQKQSITISCSYAPSYYTVVAGTNQLNATNPLRFKVGQIIVHPEYSSSLILNDVALLRLETPIEESEEVQIVGLETEYVDTVRDCVLIGWGRTSYPGSIPNDLQFLNERTYPNDECVSRWASAHAVYSSQICTLTKVGEGACHGDSGGPLVVVKDDKFSLIALVSWGSPCARGMPDVYTRVASFHEFITDNIKN
jgi:secreted trypsin-like serine protease